VVILGGVERRGRDDWRHERLSERPGFLEGLPGSLGEPPLLVVVHEDGSAVLTSDVAELPAHNGRVDVVPEDVE
jgi:hypothetical protein